MGVGRMDAGTEPDQVSITRTDIVRGLRDVGLHPGAVVGVAPRSIDLTRFPTFQLVEVGRSCPSRPRADPQRPLQA